MADRGFTIPAEDVEAAIGRGILRAVAAAQPVEPVEPAVGHAWLSPPDCARCDRQVDRFTATEDHATEKVVLVAECHGETETVDLSFVEVMLDPSIRMGVAFGEARATNTRLLSCGSTMKAEGEDG